MVDGFAKTPRYVLKDGSSPTCPAISQDSSGEYASVIFGFSDKPEYDAFQSKSTLALTPYPLVKGFLQNQLELNVASLKLIVLDPVSAGEPALYAATFESVLKAFQSDSDIVPLSHRLVLEDSSPDYRIETVSFSASQGQVS